MLAGRIKLQTFVLLIAVLSAGGIFGLYLACKSSDKPKDPPKEEAKKPDPPKELPPEPVKKAEAPPAPAPAPAPVPVADTKSDLAARPHDAEVLAWKDKSIPGDKEKDTSKGKAYKVAVYKDAGKTNVNRAKVDLNRNGKDDEKYSFEPDKITLQRAPADDEKYTETYRWNGTGWNKK
jgi:type IV secretory pathway VirB10-like protein